MEWSDPLFFYRAAAPCSIIIHGNEADIAEPGDNIRLMVKGMDESDARPGFILCPIPHPVHSARIFDAQIKILEYKSIICPGFKCVLHIHSIVEDVTITVRLAASLACCVRVWSVCWGGGVFSPSRAVTWCHVPSLEAGLSRAWSERKAFLSSQCSAAVAI